MTRSIRSSTKGYEPLPYGMCIGSSTYGFGVLSFLFATFSDTLRC